MEPLKVLKGRKGKRSREELWCYWQGLLIMFDLLTQGRVSPTAVRTWMYGTALPWCRYDEDINEPTDGKVSREGLLLPPKFKEAEEAGED
jgi:hypothetical protein